MALIDNPAHGNFIFRTKISVKLFAIGEGGRQRKGGKKENLHSVK